MHGKTIELFLVNGTSDSVVTAELSNWNGKAIKIPRMEVAKCDREDIRGVGVYFLICHEDVGQDSIYIGEAENVHKRLLQHLRDYQADKEKYYWGTAVVFVGRDLNKALIRYLEKRFVEIALECGRYRTLTKVTYDPVIKESQVATMEEFIDNVKTLLDTLGYKVLVPVPKAGDGTDFLFCSGNGAEAKGFVSPGGFTVVKNSIVSDHVTPSFKIRGKSYFDLRQKMEADAIIVDRKFVQNYEFSAPSAASAVILGRNSNGKMDWKNENGIPLGKL